MVDYITCFRIMLAFFDSTLYNDQVGAQLEFGGQHMKSTKTRLTVDLPRELVKWADTAVERGAARSRNQLITQAIDVYLHSLEEAEIDAQFKAMAEDKPYRELALQITQELEHSDWEAFQLGEGRES